MVVLQFLVFTLLMTAVLKFLPLMLQIFMLRVILKELVNCKKSSKDNLVQYFQILYEIIEMYELKGLYKDIFAKYL